MTVKKTGPRRAATAPVPGSYPTPQALPAADPVKAAEDRDESWGARPPTKATSGPNDDRLRQDVPPHW